MKISLYSGKALVLFYFCWLRKKFISPWLKAVWKGEIECRYNVFTKAFLMFSF